MKKILWILVFLMFTSCYSFKPVLKNYEFIVVDTLYRCNFGSDKSIGVIIQLNDSSLHYGIFRNSKLSYINLEEIVRNLKLNKRISNPYKDPEIYPSTFH